MLPDRDSILTKSALLIFFLIIIAYAFFEARGLLLGPRISINPYKTPVRDSFVRITGHADHITSITVGGTAIPITVDGAFEEPYVLSPGLNHITFEAKDKYGNITHSTAEIVYIVSAASSSTKYLPSATSTIHIGGTSSSTVPVAPPR